MLRRRNNREVQHLRRREEFQLGKREDMVGHREVEVAGREIRVRDTEIRADKKEETLDEIKSELKIDEASDVAGDLNKNSGTVIPADPAAKESVVALNMEKAKKVIEAVDANATLGDKFLNIPKKGKELVKSYQENKEILKNTYADNKKLASKFKAYWGAATTTAVQVARAALKQALMEEVGPGGDNVGAGSDTGSGTAGGETSTDGEANAGEEGTRGSAESRAGGEDNASEEASAAGHDSDGGKSTGRDGDSDSGKATGRDGDSDSDGADVDAE